jgi:hypothetical protein
LGFIFEMGLDLRESSGKGPEEIRAFGTVKSAAKTGESIGIGAHLPAVVNAVQSGGVQEETAIGPEPVTERLCVHEIGGNRGGILRNQFLQGGRISSAREMKTFERKRSEHQSAAGFALGCAAQKDLWLPKD